MDGREYPDSVGIASYGSLVYNLDGLAESFCALVGIGEDASGADDVRLDVIVDRNLRQSIRFRPGDKPRRISVPLAGAWQMELSVQFGSNYRTQPLVFADAAFRVKDRAAFLETLARWRNRIEAERDAPPPPVPALPEWKQVKIEKCRWNGFENAFRIGNGILEFEIVPEFGGRIVGFRRAGGENILKQPWTPLPADLRRGRNYYRQHTRFSRSEPAWYYLPGEDLHLFGPYELRFGEEGEVVMTSRPSFFLFLQVEYRIRLRLESRELELTTSYRNLGPFRRPCGIWSVVVLPTGMIAQLDAPSADGDRFDPAESAGCWNPSGKTAVLVPEDSLFARFPSVERKNRSRIMRLRARLKTGECFLLDSPASVGDRDAEFPSQLYLRPEFTELEVHSPIIDLPPGGAVSLRESWRLEEP